MSLFNFFKRDTAPQTPSIDYQYELAKIIAIYETYPVFPFIPYEDEGIDKWVETISNHPELLVKVENMTPNEDGLLPGDILLLQWLHGCSSVISEFPIIFERTYGIDPESKINAFFDKDYLDIDVSLSSLSFSSLEELNAILIEHSLPEQDTIVAAISAISSEFNDAFLEDLTYPGVYVLMPKGESLVAKYT